MKCFVRWMIVGFFLSIPACREGNTEQSKASLSSRYEAAKGISNTAEKDRSMAVVAIDAAKEGDGAIAKKAVQSISNSGTKDDAAYSAALELVRVGKGEEAKEVAQLISSAARRDEALSKIARGG